MTEQPTEPIEEITEPPEAILPIEAPAAATKSRKIRSELQLKALANARQAAYKVRAEKAELKKVKNESKKTEEVSIELPQSHPEITDDSKKMQKMIPKKIQKMKILEMSKKKMQLKMHLRNPTLTELNGMRVDKNITIILTT